MCAHSDDYLLMLLYRWCVCVEVESVTLDETQDWQCGVRSVFTLKSVFKCVLWRCESPVCYSGNLQHIRALRPDFIHLLHLHGKHTHTGAIRARGRYEGAQIKREGWV